jgi:spore coat protein CotH
MQSTFDSRTHRWETYCLSALLALAIGCGGGGETDDLDAGSADTEADADDSAGPDAAPVDLSEALFRPDHVLEVSITLDDADWAQLRAEPETIGMPKITCDNQPTERPYTYFPADITIDGETVTNVAVRKKGGFGSLSTARPGLKVKANEYVSGQRISGLKRLTLNNNHQDPTLLSQCLGYGLFRAAGVAASRCSFAHVTVNGEDLGIYSNVESIKKDFLRRHFDDEDGNLYESGGEFSTDQIGGFQPKTNKEAPDCSGLSNVATAMESSDADFVDNIGSVVNVDAFMSYWAMEVITDHWDGYANNQNNYFFYHDPTSDQMHFIPWGIDALFTGRERTTRPDSVFACGSIPWRMYNVPETRALYLARLRELLDTVWDEDAIVDEIDRMQALLEPFTDPGGTGEHAARISSIRDFVGTRKADLLAELDAGDPAWPYAAGSESCRPVIGSIAATFDTTWGTLDQYDAGTGTLTGTVGGAALTPPDASSNAGLSSENKGIIQLFSQLDDGRIAVVFILVHDPALIKPGSMAIDLVNVAAMMAFYDPATDTSSDGGLILNGTFTLSSAATTDGAAIVGAMTGDVVEL